MRINNNIISINSHRQYGINLGSVGKSTEKLSSGFRVNRAADDAAGLAISEKMRAQFRGLNRAAMNAQDGISLIQIAEGGLAGVQNIIHRIRELTVQGASDTNTQEDRNVIAKEIWQLSTEISLTEEQVEFNSMRILDTRASNPHGLTKLVLQVGANVGQTMAFDMDLAGSTNIPGGYNFNDQSLLFITSSMLNHAALALEGAQGNNDVAQSSYNYSGGPDDPSLSYLPANGGLPQRSQTEWITFMLGNVDAALNNISSVRADLGAFQNRLEFKVRNLENSAENIAAAESRIRDADMAAEMTRFTKFNILNQASTAMLAHANALPQGVLQLLG